MRRKRLAENIIQPRPSLAAISSAATTEENAPASAMLSPVKIVGSAAGNTTKAKVCAGLAPSDRAASTRCRLAPRTPAVAAVTMVGNAPMNSSTTLDRSPAPNHRISSTR